MVSHLSQSLIGVVFNLGGLNTVVSCHSGLNKVVSHHSGLATRGSGIIVVLYCSGFWSQWSLITVVSQWSLITGLSSQWSPITVVSHHSGF